MSDPVSPPDDARPESEPASPDSPAPVERPSAAEGAPTEDKPSGRIRIGTQREEPSSEPENKPAPKPVHVVTEGSADSKASSKYPPPNVRAQLSEEQEAELEAAMAGASLDALINESTANAEELAAETKLTGTVASVHGDSLFVDLGGHRQGAVPLKQFDDDKPIPDPGAQIEVVVARLNTDEGLYELSLPTAAIDIGNWDEIEVGQIIEVAIMGTNKGGLECQAAGIRGFMPMGQVSTYRVETPEDFVGQKLAAVVTEANPERKNLVVSHRAVMERERAAKREQLLAELAPGQMREGVVRSLRDFGAFVDLGGVDGLIHVSKMSWDRIGHPSEVLSEGQQVKVKIERIDPETGKIGLSYRDSAENPWDKVDASYPIGGRARGKVSKIMDFGAFVKLEPGVEGLIHISELAHGRVVRTSDAVSEGQDVEVKILSVDREKQRIGLSLKALVAPPKKEGDAEEKDEGEFVPPPDAPKAPPKRAGQLKGGTGGPSGGEKFGLKW